ncbi:MAG TPA: tetratricopeptide repeat protein [Nocardioides sp.]|nr:tetratricopeptide repeat protein [Nocardioides sp.]
MIDAGSHWDFDDPAGSERELRAVADASAGAEREAWMTQVARALGLQGRFDEAHTVLDALGGADPEVDTRIELERGRLLRSAGESTAARPHFDAAVRLARAACLEELAVDALHMVALVTAGEERAPAQQAALDAARTASDPRARDWDASILNNMGMDHADAGDQARALARFREALTARERIGDPASTRVARWMVAWSLRQLGRRDEALDLQRRLKADLEAAGEVDPYVDEELALLEE